MRFALVAVLLGSCASAPHETAWPAPHTREADGGESLAPHEARGATASKATEDDKPVAVTAVVTVPDAAAKVTPAAASPAAAATEEILQAEELVIEIDD
jgi:hypothetical protein